MEVGYCRLVTTSTDNITETDEHRTGVGAHWPFLFDAGFRAPLSSSLVWSSTRSITVTGSSAVPR